VNSPAGTNTSVNISLIITAHREGVLAGPSILSALAAKERAEKEIGVSVEMLVILDRPDAITEAVFHEKVGDAASIVVTNYGDPGLARNHGVGIARGEVVSFLDGDDLWSSNWLTEGWSFCELESDAVGHCACIVAFGQVSGVWWHIDSRRPLFDRNYLFWANYWDAMSIGRADIYRKHPFRANDLREGFGHEDWHWNVLTLEAGLQHAPVSRTIHFKRRRKGSQMSLVERSDSVIWPRRDRVTVAIEHRASPVQSGSYPAALK
jgi:glycosyltransferase involved in cell wall biosynthesis